MRAGAFADRAAAEPDVARIRDATSRLRKRRHVFVSNSGRGIGHSGVEAPPFYGDDPHMVPTEAAAFIDTLAPTAD